MNVYDLVTEKILKKLEAGIIPWRIPWTQTKGAVNWKTQMSYRGINAMLLDPGEYATFLQVKEAGGLIKKGAKGQIVVFWQKDYTKKHVVKDEKTGEEKKIKVYVERDVPFIKYSTVFEINTKVEGLVSKRNEETFDNDPIEQAEKIIEGYKDCPPVTFAPGKAFYRPSTDTISVPELSDFIKKEEYYSTNFHEMVHSTGAKKRLNRSGITEVAAFGSEIYSKEELIAEMGAAMLCGVAGIENYTIENSAAYIKSWMRKLKDDSHLIVTAAGAAQKAADYIRGISPCES